MKLKFHLDSFFMIAMIMILSMPVLFIVLGIINLRLDSIAVGLLMIFIILYFLKNIVLQFDKKIKVFNVLKGMYEINWEEIKETSFSDFSIAADIRLSYFKFGKLNKAIFPFKSKYQLCDGLNIIIKYLPIEMLDLKLLEKHQIIFDGEKFKY
jgi:hypothetical protein